MQTAEVKPRTIREQFMIAMLDAPAHEVSGAVTVQIGEILDKLQV